jgi:hypothetical protein
MSIGLERQPRMPEVAMEQLRVTGLLQRREIILLTTVMLVVGILSGLAVEWSVGRSEMEEAQVLADNALVVGAGWPLLLAAILWPLGTWRNQQPALRGAFWAAPVPRASHILARIAGGWIWLMGLAAIYLAIVALVFITRDPAQAEAVSILTHVASELIGMTIAYLLVSILAVLSNRPGMWLVGLFCAWVIAFGVGLATGSDLLIDLALGIGTFHPSNAILLATQNPSAALIWLVIGVGGCVAAAHVHPNAAGRSL